MTDLAKTDERQTRTRNSEELAAGYEARGLHEAAAGERANERHSQLVDGADDSAARIAKEPTMTLPTASPATASEVTGIRSALAALDQIAAAHATIGSAEGFLGSLRTMEVGDDDQQRYLDAQEASRNAAEKWKVAADTVRAHNDPVSEAYRTSPGAGNKTANTNE